MPLSHIEELPGEELHMIICDSLNLDICLVSKTFRENSKNVNFREARAKVLDGLADSLVLADAYGDYPPRRQWNDDSMAWVGNQLFAMTDADLPRGSRNAASVDQHADQIFARAIQSSYFTCSLLSQLREIKGTKLDDEVEGHRIFLPYMETYPARLFSIRSPDNTRLLAEVRASGNSMSSMRLGDMRGTAMLLLYEAIESGTLQDVYVFGCICALNYQENANISIDRIHWLYEHHSAKDVQAKNRCRLAAAVSARPLTAGILEYFDDPMKHCEEVMASIVDSYKKKDGADLEKYINGFPHCREVRRAEIERMRRTGTAEWLIV